MQADLTTRPANDEERTLIHGMTAEEIHRVFGSCRSADDILRTAKGLGMTLADSELYAVVNALRGSSTGVEQ